MIHGDFVNIAYFFGSEREYLREAAAMMLADMVIPGMCISMNSIDEWFVKGRVVNYSHKIFLALEREND